MTTKTKGLIKTLVAFLMGLSIVVVSTLNIDQNSSGPIALAGLGLCLVFFSIYLLIIYTVGGGDVDNSSEVMSKRH